MVARAGSYQGVVQIDRVAPVVVRKFRFRSRWLWLALALLSGVLIYRFSVISIENKVFLIRSVNIEAEVPLTESDVVALLPPLKGSGLIAIRSADLAKRVLANPWVEDVVVKKEFPQGLRLVVKTKKPAFIRSMDGKLEYADRLGRPIGLASAKELRQLDLPVLTFDDEYVKAQWEMHEVGELIRTFSESLGTRHPISEIALGDFPYFRVLLARRSMEAEFSFDTWREQAPNLTLLLDHPLEETRQARRINLVFPKKAIVSNILSK